MKYKCSEQDLLDYLKILLINPGHLTGFTKKEKEFLSHMISTYQAQGNFKGLSTKDENCKRLLTLSLEKLFALVVRCHFLNCGIEKLETYRP